MYAGSSECDLLWVGVISHVVLVSDLVRTSNERDVCVGRGGGGGGGLKLPGYTIIMIFVIIITFL